MIYDLVVLGGGIAGTAAALSARRTHERVALVAGGSGATALSSGALDWESGESQGESESLASEEMDVLSLLGAYDVPARDCVLASSVGTLRRARGRDRGLLDLSKLPPGRVLVMGGLQGWEPRFLARSWTAQSLTHHARLEFVAATTSLRRYTDETRMNEVELARRYDDAGRISWLAASIREELAGAPGVVGVLLPSVLGVDKSRSEELSILVRAPCGEAMGGLPSTPGMRFLAARDRALTVRGITVVREYASKSAAVEGGWAVELERGERIQTRVLVLAIGGLLGGGITYDPSEVAWATSVPPSARPSFRWSIDVGDLPLSVNGGPESRPSSLFGVPPEELAWPCASPPILSRVGAQGGGDPSLRVCGTSSYGVTGWLSALRSGVRAGSEPPATVAPKGAEKPL